MAMQSAVPEPSITPFSGPGGRLVSVDGRELPLRSVEVRASAGGGLAQTVVEQVFENVHDAPLEVTYRLPLPADGAVSDFQFRMGDVTVRGEVQKREIAREMYLEALQEGKTAALVEEERTSVFTQRIGNIPPRATVTCFISVDQPLTWTGDGSWEWRFPTVVGPRYTGAGKTPDAAQIHVDVADGHLPLRAGLELRIEDTIAINGRIESPSHPCNARDDDGAQLVKFAEDTRMRLDRDIVVRWPVTIDSVGASVLTEREPEDTNEEAWGLVTLVPPKVGMGPQPVARDLTLLIDTSGSMSGQPLRDAVAVVEAMIESLTGRDRLELISFSFTPQAWQPEPVPATDENKRAAIAFANGLEAAGGTEMESGLRRALEPLRPGSQRQVVLLTDGYIGFESRIVRQVLDGLPPSCRLHAVGVGSAVNRTLLQGVTRAGSGVEVIIGSNEDPMRAARRLLARTVRPIVTGLSILGNAVKQSVPRALPDLYAGSPALIGLHLDAQGGEVTVRGNTAEGVWEHQIKVPPVPLGQGQGSVRRLFAREWVADLETNRIAGDPVSEIDAQIEHIGLEHRISTRLTSWVAVSDTKTVKGDNELLLGTVPQELPHGVSAEGLGIRAAIGAPKTHPFKAPAKTGLRETGWTDRYNMIRETEVGSLRKKRITDSDQLRGFLDSGSVDNSVEVREGEFSLDPVLAPNFATTDDAEDTNVHESSTPSTAESESPEAVKPESGGILVKNSLSEFVARYSKYGWIAIVLTIVLVLLWLLF